MCRPSRLRPATHGRPFHEVRHELPLRRPYDPPDGKGPVLTRMTFFPSRSFLCSCRSALDGFTHGPTELSGKMSETRDLYLIFPRVESTSNLRQSLLDEVSLFMGLSVCHSDCHYSFLLRPSPQSLTIRPFPPVPSIGTPSHIDFLSLLDSLLVRSIPLLVHISGSAQSPSRSSTQTDPISLTSSLTGFDSRLCVTPRSRRTHDIRREWCPKPRLTIPFGFYRLDSPLQLV